MASPMRTHIHGRVRTQLIILGIVCLGLIGGVLYDVFVGGVNFFLALLALVVGIGAGFVVSRMFVLSWHEETRKVIMSFDRMSIILIAAYIAFRIFGNELLGHYVQGITLSALTYALLAGILLGRLLGVWRGVKRILREQGILQ